MTEGALIARAVTALNKRAKRDGHSPQQASIAESDYDEASGIVTLRNVNGVIGAYRYNAKTDRLSYIKS